MKTARVTVQFQSVIEKLSPHDTIFSFTQPADLRDSALSSACSLHTANTSIKSSNDSLPQQGLAEITEDLSEPRADALECRLSHGGITGDGVQIRPEKVNESASANLTRHRSTSAATQSSFRSRTTSNTDKPLPPPPPPPDDHTYEERSRGSIFDYGEHNTRISTEGRFSSNSARPSTRDLYDAYGYKKKIKMGPRPSIDSVGAQNNSGTQNDEFRPVSTLPAGLRMPPRKAVPATPASQQSQAIPPIQTIPSIKPSLPARANSSEKMTPKKAPAVPVAPICIPDRNMPSPTIGLKTTKLPELGSQKMTPEKLRLMKALKLRKEQIAAQNSVNGLGIKNEEPEFSKVEIDESILSAVVSASSPREESEPISIVSKDPAKEGSRLLEDSPISIPETTEELSTKASSITDEEEAVAQKRQEIHAVTVTPVSKLQNLDDNLSKEPRCHLSDKDDPGLEDPENELLTGISVTESPRFPRQPSAPTQSRIFAAGQDVVERKLAVKESPEAQKDDHATMMDRQLSAEEVGGDKQRLPSEQVQSQIPRIQSIADDEAPLRDPIITPTLELDENSKVQQSEPLGGYEKAASKGEAVNTGDVQPHPLLDSEEFESTRSTDDQARVLQNQLEGHKQSSEHPILKSDESASEAPNDIVQPLLVRRSSSSKSIRIPSDNVNAHEVPLPPIDEDEEISLSPQRALFLEEAATHPSRSDGELKAAMLQAHPSPQISDHMVTGRSTSNGMGERHFRRQGAGNSIKRAPSPDQSDEQFLSDDSFMEELKSATVQEAKPVSVSKSPIKPVFSRSESEQKLNGSAKGSRSVSTPLDHSNKNVEVILSPRPPMPLSTPRSFSAQHSPRPDSQQPNAQISKKIGVSSSISQRIKALEQLSSRPTSPVSPKLASNTSTFLGLRTISLRSPSGSSEYKNSSYNRGRPDTAYTSPPPSRETVKSSIANKSTTVDLPGPTKSAIDTSVHDAREKSPIILSHQTEPRHLDLRENFLHVVVPKSPLPTEQKTMAPPPLSPLKPPRPRFGRYSSKRSESSSSNEQKLEPQPTTRRNSFASIHSKSSRAGSEVELPRALSDSSQSGMTSPDSTQDEKKDSRRSRLLKRMSNISSVSRRSIAHALSPSPKEAPIIERQEPTQEAPSTSLDVGDVNIQFPDTLVSSVSKISLAAANNLVSCGKGDIWLLTRKVF